MVEKKIESLLQTVSGKLASFDVTGAVRILSSDSSLSNHFKETVKLGVHQSAGGAPNFLNLPGAPAGEVACDPPPGAKADDAEHVLMPADAGDLDALISVADVPCEGSADDIVEDFSIRVRSKSKRDLILEAATALGLIIEERPFSVEEAQLATEAFITSSTSFITSVVEINGRIIGNHEIESITKELRRLYLKNIQK